MIYQIQHHINHRQTDLLELPNSCDAQYFCENHDLDFFQYSLMN